MTTPDGLTAEAVLDLCHRDLTTPDAEALLAENPLLVDALEFAHQRALVGLVHTAPYWRDCEFFPCNAYDRIEAATLARHVRETGCEAIREALDRLAWCAVRYGLGRRTYVTADIAETVARVKDSLREDTRRIIVTDIDRAEERGPDGLGDTVDAGVWRGLRAALAPTVAASVCAWSYGGISCGRPKDHPFHAHDLSKPHAPMQECHTFAPSPATEAER